MPESIGQYRLIERIASGGMGEVFKAKLVREGGFEKIVAIKRMLPNLSHDAAFEARFCSEARLSARLNHTNIVHVYDFGRQADTLFLAMEYVEGVDLRSLLAQLREGGERLPVAVALDIAIQACRGLDYAHRIKDEQGRELGLIHRDISPSNLLLSFEGEVKLTDFGLAAVRKQAGQDHLAGKYSYMPPEQIRGEPLDRRSDLYSLGLVLHEMLTNRQSYPSAIPPEALMRQIVSGTLEPPEAPGVSSSLADTVMDACALEKADRPPTTEEWRRRLQNEREALNPASIEAIPEMLKRLFPDRHDTPTPTNERTILSTQPIITPTDDATDESRPSAITPTKKASPHFALWTSLLILLAIASVVGYFRFFNTPSGSIVIESQPPGASVFHNGRNTGKRTPTTLSDLDQQQSHNLRLIQKYHVDWEQTITLESSEPVHVRAELERQRQACRLITTPPDAAVWLNNRKLAANTPVSVGKLTLGDVHHLRIEKEGYVALQTDFILDQAEAGEKSLSYNLQSLYRQLTIMTDPPDSVLRVDDERIDGSSPFDVQNLLPNRPIRIIAGKKGFQTVAKTVTPSSLAGPLHLKLSPFHATVVLDAPDGARVKLDGNAVPIPHTLQDAQKTQHLIVITFPGDTGKLVLRLKVRQIENRRGHFVPEAKLNLDAQPWATLTLDNQKPFTTPSSGQRLAAGRHQLKVQMRDSTVSHTVNLHVK